MQDDLSSWDVLVGRVRSRWNRADLKVQSFSETPGRFEAGAQLCARLEDGLKPMQKLLTIRSSRASGHDLILDCGLASPEIAEGLRGAGLFIHPSMRPILPEGEFYLDELLGLRVQTEAGEDLGEIEEVLETPANNVYVTPRALIPGLSEFIVSTDFQAKLMIVRDVPGLRTEEV